MFGLDSWVGICKTDFNHKNSNTQIAANVDLLLPSLGAGPLEGNGHNSDRTRLCINHKVNMVK